MKSKTLLTVICTMVLLTASSSAADAKTNYDKNCAKCHGPDGKGQTRMGKQAGARDYTDEKVQAELDDARAFKSIKEGQTIKGKEAMKPFGDKLSDDEIKELVTLMRAFKK
ncbi:MAG: cytochrome c [Verrucomicrobiota bacterium]|nr:cytochrome c [Verrucomicrobiota bacterium]